MASQTENIIAEMLKYKQAASDAIIPEAGGGPTAGGGLPWGGAKEGLGTRVAKKVGPHVPGLLLFAALQKMLNLPTEIGESRLQQEALQSQGRSTTPESLYYQAVLPQAQEEEAQARQGLMAHLSGGVLGPVLARGERLIGGR